MVFACLERGEHLHINLVVFFVIPRSNAMRMEHTERNGYSILPLMFVVAVVVLVQFE